MSAMTSAVLDTPPLDKPVKTRGTSPRSRAREFALQALYQFIVSQNDMKSIDSFTQNLTGFHKASVEHYDALIYGCVREQAKLDAQLAAYLDRAWHEISPIEHVVMWIGAYEYLHCQDVPWRVVLNECIELAKTFGGTDGHKYVNGILHQLGSCVRANEMDTRAAPKLHKKINRAPLA